MIDAQAAVDKFVKEMPNFKDVIIVFLYGSLARKEYSKRHSDIDLLIVVNKKKVPSSLIDKIEDLVSRINAKLRVRIQPEFQAISISKEDGSLLRKMLEEGEVVYASGMFVLGNGQLGLKAYYIFTFNVKDRVKQTRLSQILHGRKSWYYKGKEKVVKTYPGIIDETEIIGVGKGGVMVSREKREYVEQMLKAFGAEYRIKKIVYAV
ncbi:MAG: nucleotidyltransferase domain-containing protein [Candidatus Woesearchaeota archaeon]